ncbi:MAG: O-antigen translocase [Verrucomicrobiota bacterium]
MSTLSKDPVPGDLASRLTSDSYSQILRSSSIIGGAQGVTYLIGIVRTKLVAILLGPAGIGLVGLYHSAISMVGSFSTLGITSSGVKEIAEANGKGNPAAVAQTIKTLRRACWVTGFLGWLLSIALSYPLSLWIFDSGDRAWPIALLGITLLLGSISGGQRALLQSVRKIGDLARLNVISAIVSTVVAVGIYLWLGENGIVPVLITTAALNIIVSWWFARKVEIVVVTQTLAATLRNSKKLIGLGLAFMWSGIVSAGVALAIRSLIIREIGLDANGIYQAAWGISGMFGGFILSAMGADFYPRLTAVGEDNAAVNKLVNEQTEIGVLLGLPGIVGTLALAPWMMQVFYTSEFLPGAELLPCFVLGVFGRVVSAPMSYILLAKGASRGFAATETVSATLHLGLCIVFLHNLGLWGISLAFACLYGVHVLGMLKVSAHLSNFRWTPAVLKLLIISTILVTTEFFALKHFSGLAGVCAGGVLFTISGIFSLRGIASRLGKAHKLVQLACRIPGGRKLCGI